MQIVQQLDAVTFILLFNWKKKSTFVGTQFSFILKSVIIMLQLKCVKYYGPFILKENRDQFLHPTERIYVSKHNTGYNIKLDYTDNEK